MFPASSVNLGHETFGKVVNLTVRPAVGCGLDRRRDPALNYTHIREECATRNAKGSNSWCRERWRVGGTGEKVVQAGRTSGALLDELC